MIYCKIKNRKKKWSWWKYKIPIKISCFLFNQKIHKWLKINKIPFELQLSKCLKLLIQNKPALYNNQKI